MKTLVDEIAPGIYRLSTYVSKISLQFNQFLIQDDEPLLYHTGLRGMFPDITQAVSRILNPASISWISFSHFESDECGSLQEWMALAPNAQPVCGAVGAMVNINDFIGGRARVVAGDQTLQTGRYRFRFLETPHVPHGWDAGLLFEESGATLFCSDLFLQNGDLPPLTEKDLVEPARQALLGYESGPLAHPYPYTSTTRSTLEKLALLKPKLLAIMHGSSYSGNGEEALRDLAAMFAETIGPSSTPPYR